MYIKVLQVTLFNTPAPLRCTVYMATLISLVFTKLIFAFQGKPLGLPQTGDDFLK